jgi:hypothetical protein
VIAARRIASTNDPSYLPLWNIYAEAIPKHEAKGPEEFSQLISRNDYSVLVFEESSHIVAFTMMFMPSDSNYALLEYMAVSKAARSTGVGSAAFQAAISQTHLPLQYEVVVIEVDSPREKTAPDVAVRERRIEFYRRNGCQRVEGLHYLFPLVCEKPPPQMDLLVHLRGKPRPLSKSDFCNWITSIFVHVYGYESTDSRIKTMLNSLSHEITLS